MDIETLLQVVSGGSDVALIAIGLAIWKIERRVYKIENRMEQKNGLA